MLLSPIGGGGEVELKRKRGRQLSLPHPDNVLAFAKHGSTSPASPRQAQKPVVQQQVEPTSSARKRPPAARPGPEARSIAGARRKQITALLRDRCAGPCLTDDALTFFEEVVVQLAIVCSPAGYPDARDEWVAQHTPLLTAAEVADAEARILPNPPPYTSAALGRRLCVTPDEWARLGLSHITPKGWTKTRVDAERGKKRNARRQARRLETGETKNPHSASKTRNKPWLAAGHKSRRAWELAGQPGPLEAAE